MRQLFPIIALISLALSPSAFCLGTKGSGRLGSGGGKSKSSSSSSSTIANDGNAAASSIEKGRRLASTTKKKIKEKSKSIQSTLAEAKASMTVSSIIPQSISIPVDVDLDLEGIKGGIKSGIQDGKGLFFDSLSRVDLEKSSIALLIAELKQKVKSGDISDMVRGHRHEHDQVNISDVLSYGRDQDEGKEIQGEIQTYDSILQIRGGRISSSNSKRNIGTQYEHQKINIKNHDQICWTDEIAKNICLSLASLVGLQAFATLLSTNDFELFDEVCLG